jgi:hypothetical protein
MAQKNHGKNKNRINNMRTLLKIVLFSVCAISGYSQERKTVLLDDGWKLWHDKQAVWQNDSLYLPSEVVIRELAKTAPAPVGGWAIFDGRPDGTVDVDLPALVEEYLTPDGHVDTYLPGVFWFWKDVKIPAAWTGKIFRLNIGSYRLRIEVYVNEKLVGYDIVGEIPYSCDLTEAMQCGKTNRIAIRVTNPGGVERGWKDSPMFQWGDYNFASSRHFGGIPGDVELVVTDSVYIEDVYVKNLNTPDYRTVEVQTAVNSRLQGDTKAEIRYEIIPVSGRKAIYQKSETIVASSNQSVYKQTVSCPEAALWNTETPELYLCRVTVRSGHRKDTYSQRFGFRVFEVKRKEGNSQAHYYFNGKRIIFKGGIDFSYYAYTGLYPVDATAEKTVLAAKQIGHNAINFHRQTGSPAVFAKADELGLFTYEETGAMHESKENYFVSQQPFAATLAMEKWRRMVVRDRNHPSLIIYNLQNEAPGWNEFRKRLMETVHSLDEGRLVTNSSGGDGGGSGAHIHHIRPYEKHIRQDFTDDHTVGAGILFDEKDFNKHIPADNENIHYWGEVKCYSAPDNWVAIADTYERLKSRKSAGYKGYNYSHYLSFAQKIKTFFDEHAIAHNGSGIIRTPGDIPKAASSGKMYNDGRNAQNIMSHNGADGYAINAWSGGNGREGWNSWYSGIVDDDRNVKGDPAIYACYTRPLQIVIQRLADGAGGKFFDIAGKAAFKIKLINQGILPAGDYTLKLKLKDGAGVYHPEYNRTLPVHVEGDDVFAQDIDLAYIVPMNKHLHGGFITLEGELYDGQDKRMTDGAEQILLANRPSFESVFKDITVEVHEWQAARKALDDAGANVRDFAPETKADYITASGKVSPEIFDAMLKKVKAGATLIIRMDTFWAEMLRKKEVLSAEVVEWGTPQSGHWNGDGFGYIDYFGGQTTVSLNGWEVTEKGLNGFYPLKSKYPTKIDGVYVARPDVLRVLMGSIGFGQGRILLNAAYPVDISSPLNDLLFYNMFLTR